MGDRYHPFPRREQYHADQERQSGYDGPSNRYEQRSRNFNSNNFPPYKRARSEAAQQRFRASPNGSGKQPLREDPYSTSPQRWSDQGSPGDGFRPNPRLSPPCSSPPNSATPHPEISAARPPQRARLQNLPSAPRRCLSRDRTVSAPLGPGSSMRPMKAPPASNPFASKLLQQQRKSESQSFDRKPGVSAIARPPQSAARAVPSKEHEHVLTQSNGPNREISRDSHHGSEVEVRTSQELRSERAEAGKSVDRSDQEHGNPHPEGQGLKSEREEQDSQQPAKISLKNSNAQASNGRVPQLPEADAVGSTRPNLFRHGSAKAVDVDNVNSGERPSIPKSRSPSVPLPKSRDKTAARYESSKRRKGRSEVPRAPAIHLRSVPAPDQPLVIPKLKSELAPPSRSDENIKKRYVEEVEVEEVAADSPPAQIESGVDDAVEVVSGSVKKRTSADTVEKHTRRESTEEAPRVPDDDQDTVREIRDSESHRQRRDGAPGVMPIVNLEEQDAVQEEADVVENIPDKWPFHEPQRYDRADLKRILETQVRRTQPHINFSSCGMEYDDAMFVIHLIRATQYRYSTNISLHNNNLDACTRAFLSGLKELHVRVLDLSMNRLNHVHDTISVCQDLCSLDLSRNRLTYLPDSLCDLVALEILDVAKNYIKALPRGFSKLKKLQTLNLSQNRLTELPNDWADEHMEISALDLSRNKNFACFPLCTKNLTKLKDLHITGTVFERSLRPGDSRHLQFPMRLMREVAGKTLEELQARKKTKPSRAARDSNIQDVETVDT